VIDLIVVTTEDHTGSIHLILSIFGVKVIVIDFSKGTWAVGLQVCVYNFGNKNSFLKSIKRATSSAVHTAASLRVNPMTP